jgi:hypothetical protein
MQLEAMIDQDLEEHVALDNQQAANFEAIQPVVGVMVADETLIIG